MNDKDMFEPIGDVENKRLVKELRQYLIDTKYVTYARLMSIYKVRFDANKDVAPAFTDGDAIHIVKGMTFQEQSILVRHELLHILLHHKDDDTWKKGQDDHTKRNIAGDAELSNYYDDYDNIVFGYGGPLSDGINVYVNNSQWKGKTAPEVYADLAKKSKRDKELRQAIEEFSGNNPFGDCIPKAVPKPSGTGVDPVTGAPSNEGLATGDLDEEESTRVLKELLKVSHDTSHAPAPLDENIGGVVDREAVEAETKLYASLTRYFSEATRPEKRRTYSSPHKRSTPSLLKRGRRRMPVEEQTLVVYVDRSGSMTETKTGKADKIVENTARRLRGVTVIKKYFANGISEDPLHGIGGGTNYSAIANDVRKNRYKTIAIVTDDDLSNITASDKIKVDMAWVCAVESKRTMVADDIVSNKTMLEVAL